MSTVNIRFARMALGLGVALGFAACGEDADPQLPIQPAPQRGMASTGFAKQIAVAESLTAVLTTASPAISAAVAVGDSIVWSAAFGFSDMEANTRATPASRFRIYSLSKGLTATSALWLREQHQLDLDAPVSRYVAEAPAGGATSRQLLGHLGGIRHYKGSEAIGTRNCARPVDAVKIFGKDPLVSEPGSAYLYSSWGYATLSAVLENASGSSFDSVVARAVLTPAGMRATGLPSSDALLPAEVLPYEPTNGGVKPARKVNNRCKLGGGAFVSTAEDVARFGAALVGGKLIPAAAVEELFTPMRTADGTSTEYGMGFGVATDSTGRRRITHSGSAMGGRSAIVMFPDQRVVVVILSNVEGERLVPTALALANTFARVPAR